MVLDIEHLHTYKHLLTLLKSYGELYAYLILRQGCRKEKSIQCGMVSWTVFRTNHRITYYQFKTRFFALLRRGLSDTRPIIPK